MKRKSHLLRLMKLVWLVSCICPQARGEVEGIYPLLDQAIREESGKLTPNSLKLPELAKEVITPPLIASAGKDFIVAWTTWQRVIFSPSGDTRAKAKNADDYPNRPYAERELFDDLLRRSISANPAPKPEEFDRFSGNSKIWCEPDGGRARFNETSRMGLVLAYLREGRVLEAIRWSHNRDGEAIECMLRSLGVDQEEFRIGEWLNGWRTTEFLCKTGGERTARMVMTWVNLRWQVELERSRKSPSCPIASSPKEPRSSSVDLVYLLRPDNGVTDDTKSSIVNFIQSRGLEIMPADSWLQRCPKGAEGWLAPLSR